MSTQSSLLKPPPRQQKKSLAPSNDFKNKSSSLTKTHPLYGNSESRICSKCHKHPTNVKGGCLVRVHHLSSSAWIQNHYNNSAAHPSNNNNGGGTSLLRVCEECVIGYTLPVYRSAFHKYEMGTIRSYDENSMRHQFEFADGSLEWFHVDEDPYLRYSQWTEECRRQRYYQHHHVTPLSDPNYPPFGTVGLGKTVGDDPAQNFEYDSKMGAGIGLSTEDLTSPIEPLKEGNIHAMNPLTSTATSNNDQPFNSPPTLPFDPSLGLPSFSFDYDHDDGASISGLQFSFGLQNSWSFEDPTPSPASIGPGRDLHGHSAHDPTTTSVVKNNKKSPTRTIVTDHLSPSASMFNFNEDEMKNFNEEEKKKGPRFWTEVEDNLLLDAVAKSTNPVEWPVIAAQVPGRNQKQCRERYLNHLNPNIRVGDWSPKEDALICMLERSEGKSWRLFTKIPCLDGRTDNSIKNRFNHLNRRFLRVMKEVEVTPEMEQTIQHIKTTPLFKLSEERSSARTDPVSLKYAAKRIEDPEDKKMKTLSEGDLSFGPFRTVHDQSETVVCQRCSLVVPSKQTGDAVCTVTGWCRNCTNTSVQLAKEMLLVARDLDGDKTNGVSDDVEMDVLQSNDNETTMMDI